MENNDIDIELLEQKILSLLDDKERTAYNIAKSHLGSAFQIKTVLNNLSSSSSFT